MIMRRLAMSPHPTSSGSMDGDSGATAIVSVPQNERGLEKAVMLERYIAVQIRVTHNDGFLLAAVSNFTLRGLYL